MLTGVRDLNLGLIEVNWRTGTGAENLERLGYSRERLKLLED